MKKHILRFLSLILVLFCTAAVVLPHRAAATPTVFDTYLSRLATLEELANSYRSSNGISTGTDQLMLRYIRSARYSGTTWDTLAGKADNNFISYVQQQSPDTVKLRSTDSLTLPNGETTDIIHMFAVMNMEQCSYGDLGGWIGDTCQMLEDIKNDSGTAEELTEKAHQHFRIDGHFGLQDWIADLDGYNLTKEKQNGETWAACFARYFSPTLTEKQRVARFVERRWGSDYTGETATKEQYRNFVKSCYNTPTIKALLLNTYGLSNIPAQQYQDAVCYVVADYCYGTLCAPNADAETVRIDYAAEKLQLSAGISANSDSSFTGTDYADGSAVTPGMTFYAKGVRDMESGSFFPTATAEFTLPQRPSAPAAPQLVKAAAGSLSFVSVPGVEYSADGGQTWQDNAEFTDLIPHTVYEIVCRYKATETAFCSELSPACAEETLYPGGLYVNSQGAFFTAGDQVQLMLLASYSKDGRLTKLTPATLQNGIWQCALPTDITEGRACIYVISTNNTPLTEAYMVTK